MSDLWLKIKFWIKTTLISVLAVYTGLFIYNNSGETRQINFWWWFGQEPKTSVFVLALVSFLAGMVTTLLIRTTFTTIKQFRLMKAAKATRDVAEMQMKAAKLQTRSANSPVAPDPTQL